MDIYQLCIPQFRAHPRGKVHGQLVAVLNKLFPMTATESPWGSEEEDREWEAELAVGCDGKQQLLCQMLLDVVKPQLARVRVQIFLPIREQDVPTLPNPR